MLFISPSQVVLSLSQPIIYSKLQIKLATIIIEIQKADSLSHNL